MAVNRILKSMLNTLKDKYSLDGNESKLFEHMVNYVTVSKYHMDAFCEKGDFEQLVVDGKGLFGIDSIAFIVNGNLIQSTEDIKDFAKLNHLDIIIMINQAKTTESVDSGELLKTICATKNFLGNRDLLEDMTPELKKAYEIYDTIYKYSRYFSKESPRLHINFCTAAAMWEEKFVSALKSQEEELIKEHTELKQVYIHVYGVDDIIQQYKELENNYEVEIKFKDNLSLDKIVGVEQAYIGYLPGGEYLKIITDKSKQRIRSKVFYENVRDYQGKQNPVNQEIAHTLNESGLRDKFIILNNGVTIVTKSLMSLGANMFSIREFQVVNGCQTSHEIYNARSYADKILVPVKIIHTTDADVISMIVKSTNRQTPVPSEAFFALDFYHKKLQLLFEAYSKEAKIKMFYERRIGELTLGSDKKRSGAINLHSLVRSATSVIFQEPYIVYNNNPANILRNRKEKLFKKEHPCEIYYFSAYLFVFLQRELHLNGYEYKFRFYIIMVTAILLVGAIDHNRIDKKKEKEIKGVIKKIFSNEIDLFSIMGQAKDIVLDYYGLHREQYIDIDAGVRNPSFNVQLLKCVKQSIVGNKS